MMPWPSCGYHTVIASHRVSRQHALVPLKGQVPRAVGSTADGDNVTPESESESVNISIAEFAQRSLPTWQKLNSLSPLHWNADKNMTTRPPW